MATKKKTSKSTAAKSSSRTKKALSSKPNNKSVKSNANINSSVKSISASANSKNAMFTTLKFRKLYLILAVIFILLIALIANYKSVFVAAVVNGQPISRLAVVKETEKQAGKQSLENIIRNTLIEQEAREKGVSVPEEEIDEEIKKVEKNLKDQGQEIDQVLEAQGLSREDLRKLIKLDKIVAKIVGEDINISDKEVNEYIENNREVLPQDKSEEELKKTVRENLRQQKLSEKVQTWLTDLKAKANINYIVEY